MATSLQDWLLTLEQRHPKAIDLGLDRCRAVYERLGSPRPARTVWTIAGTNGKGSVTRYLDSLARALGWNSGTFTSPHILCFNERIHIGPEQVSDAEIVDAFEKVEAARDGVSLTYFEFTTIAALLLFSNAGLDGVALEVGLGGRLDAVNLVDPDCAVITPVGLDHMEYLGHDREQIGREKAGILRHGIPVVLAESQPPASILEEAGRLACPVYRAGQEFRWEVEGGRFHYFCEEKSLCLPLPPLPGSHQAANAAAALTALSVIVPDSLESEAVLARGLTATRLPGRLQPWDADPRVVLDVGHNPLAAAVVREFLDTGSDSWFCVLAMLADKDAEAVARELAPAVDGFFCAGLSGARGQAGAALAQRIRGEAAGRAVKAFDTVREALDSALQAAGSAGRVLVFGSFATVAEVLESRPGHSC